MMVSLALAMNINYENQMNQWGALSLIEVTAKDSMDELVEVTALDDKAILALESLTEVEKVMPMIQTSMTLTIGSYGTMRAVTIIGYDADELEALGYMAEEGRNYEYGEENVILVGGKITEQLVKKGEDMNKSRQTGKSSSTQGNMGGMSSVMPPTMGSSGGGRSNSSNMGGGFPGNMPEGMSSDKMMEQIENVKGNTSTQSGPDLYNDRVNITFETFTFRMPQDMGEQGNSNSSTSISTPKPISMKIVGKLPSGNSDTDSYIFMPRETVLRLIQQKEIYDAKVANRAPSSNPIEEYDKVLVKVYNSDDVEKVRAQIERLGFESEGAQDTLDEMKNMSSNIQVILMAIGAISLVVAAIGITNTMMMSIYERTKEIGVMKVIGALITDIKQMFLVEAAIIGFVGGLVGIGLCYAISYLLNTYGTEFFSGLVSTSTSYQTYVSVITPWLAGGAILFATLIGLVAGYMPAKRATALSALTAIKTQ